MPPTVITSHMRIHNINLSRSSRDNIFIYRNHAYTWYFDFFLHLCGILFLIKCPGLQYGILCQNDIEPFLSKINWYWCMPIKVHFLTECSFFTSFYLRKIRQFSCIFACIFYFKKTPVVAYQQIYI